MEKTPKEVLKAYVDSQKFSSTTQIMDAMKEMQGHPHHRLERADQSGRMEGGMGEALQSGVGAERTRGARRPPQL